MRKTNLIIAIRSLKKHLVYTWVNVLGLAIALCCVFLTFLYTQHERNFDKAYPDSGQINRLVIDGMNWGSKKRTSSLPYIHSRGLEENFPQVEAVASCLFEYNSALVRAKARYELAFEEQELIYAEPSFLSIFGPEIIAGDVNLFDRPGKMLLAQRTAKRYFGDAKAVGKVMFVGKREFEVIAVYDDFETNSSVNPQFLLSMETLKVDPSAADRFQKEGYYIFQTFVKLDKSADPSVMAGELTAFTKSKGLMQGGQHFVLDPLEAYHFNTTDYVPTLAAKADEKLIIWLVAISIGLLLVAIANFGNISMAIVLSKTKEVAVRKIIGANKIQIVKRGLFESLLLTFISFLGALILLEVLLPVFSDFVDRDLSAETAGLSTYLVLFVMAMSVGLVAGVYPALLMSNIKVMHLFKAGNTGKISRVNFKSALLSFQFIITFILLAVTFFMNRQIDFMLSKDPGFDYEDVVVFTPIWFSDRDASAISSFRNELVAMPEVEDLTISDIHPLAVFRGHELSKRDLRGAGTSQSILIGGVDCHFFDFYNIRKDMSQDVLDQFCEKSLISVLNQRAIDGFETDAEGKTFIHFYKGRVTDYIVQSGVVPDFYYTSVKDSPVPIAFIPIGASNGRNSFSIKLNKGADQAAFISKVNQMWWELEPSKPFDLKILEDEHKRLYSSEMKLKSMASVLAMAVCVIAFAGVFALSVFYGRQKLKEVGIRKVLGASFNHLFYLQSKTFLMILAASCLVAVPVVQQVMKGWMEQFASQVEISYWVYLLTGLTLLVCTILSAGWYSSKVARVNPSEIIRNN